MRSRLGRRPWARCQTTISCDLFARGMSCMRSRCADDCGKLLALRCGQKLQKDGSDILERVASHNSFLTKCSLGCTYPHRRIHAPWTAFHIISPCAVPGRNRFRAGSLGVRFKKPVKAAIWDSWLVGHAARRRGKRVRRLRNGGCC